MPNSAATNSDNEDDERNVLASIHASLRDQNAYEGEVLRQATHQLAPALTSSLGFPDLNSLAEFEVPVLHSILASTRRQIKATQDNDLENDSLHRMKEQILLHLLSTVSPESLPVRLFDERLAEQARSLRLVQQRHRRDASPTASVATDILARTCEVQPPKQPQRARVPMMKRKRMETKDESVTIPELNNEQREELRRLRTEGRRRRHERRKLLLDGSSSSSDDELMFGQNDEAIDVVQKTIAKPVGDFRTALCELAIDEANEDDKSEGNPRIAPNAKVMTALSCPLCQEVIAVADGLDTDEVLSQHMSFGCKQNSSRPSRRSTRGSRGCAVVSYAEDETNFVSSPRPADLLKVLPSKRSGKQARQSRGKQLSAKVSGSKSIPSAPSNGGALMALDDIDEWVYEDRVDDWIENGLGRMKIMKERDDGEVLPGPEEYDGGLLIPAWMNNRLFGYQREGLKWMWDLHQQESGGIIGDEMGLVRRSHIVRVNSNPRSTDKRAPHFFSSCRARRCRWHRSLARLWHREK